MQTSMKESKMYLKVDDSTFEFEIIPLTFERKDISNVFYKKNNKTLKQTFEHQRYSHLKLKLADKYKDYLEEKLGDFLRRLKEANDDNYKFFLNRYGDKKFCEFKINSHLNSKGIYCYIVEEEIKYIGRCTDDFKTRINQGYGKISPKKCFIDGQSTNCNINSLINSTDNVKFGVYVMTDGTEIERLEKLILNYDKPEWNKTT